MKIKLNKFERVAGTFVLAAMLGVLVSVFTVAVKQGWFENKVYYTTLFETADGIHQGTTVQVAGLKAGSVEDVELLSNNQIKVHFYVLGRFQKRIKEDSLAQLIRPFIIGERVLEVTVGSAVSPLALENSQIKSQETMDLMTLISGKNLNSYFQRVSGLIENLSVLLDAFASKKRAETVVSIFDKLDPLMTNLNRMSVEMVTLSRQASQHGQLGVLLTEVTKTMVEMNKILPQMNNSNPEFGKNVGVLAKNIVEVSEEMKILTPALKELQPELPQAGRRLIEVLNETAITLKAMQKTIFLRGSVEDVLAEEKEREESQKRRPANR